MSCVQFETVPVSRFWNPPWLRTSKSRYQIFVFNVLMISLRVSQSCRRSSSHFAKVFIRIGYTTREMTICWHSRSRPIEAQMPGHNANDSACKGLVDVFGEHGPIRTGALIRESRSTRCSRSTRRSRPSLREACFGRRSADRRGQLLNFNPVKDGLRRFVNTSCSVFRAVREKPRTKHGLLRVSGRS
jgi:hypothetical protein